MDTDRIKNQIGELQEQIQAVAKAPISNESELEKRQLWRSLELLKISIDTKQVDVTPQASKDFEEICHPLAEMLSLKRHTREISSIIGAIRFGAFFLVTTMMFPIFAAAFPLRWMHPLLRKLGVKNNKLPYDFVPRLWGAWSMLVFGIRSRIEGWEHIKQHADNGTSTIGLFQHSSFYDFIMVMGSCPLVFKWVAKRSLYKIPMLGQMAWLAGMIPIDRENLDSAKRSLDNAAHAAQQYQRSIAIAPEGTRSTNGQLLDFKKGAFHLALKCQVDCTPMVLFGAYHLWSPGSFFPSPGVITLRFLKPIKTTDYLPDKYNQLLHDVRVAMLESMANPPSEITPSTSVGYSILSYLSVAATYGIFAGSIWGICKIFH